MVEESGICSLDGVVFGKVGGDVDIWMVGIEHSEMGMVIENRLEISRMRLGKG